ncbi:hypothetical protein BY996DRAFT_3818849 [Phakopsora pachyrhizi]|nr:hypothetical protein BY996DRAFT_3818849 [Phakopsora pachyrhizi]
MVCRKTSSIIIGIGLALIFLSVHLAIFFFSPWKLARVVAMPLLWAAMIIILNSVQRIYLSNYVFKKTTIARPFEGWFAALKTERKKLKLFKTQKNSAKNHILMELPIVQRVIEKKPIVNINTSLISNSNSTALVIESEEEAKYFRTKLPSVPSRALKKSDWQEPTTWSPSELEVRALNQKLCLESSIKPKYTLEPSYRWIFLKSTIFTIFFSIFWLLIWIPLPPPFH